MRFMNMIVAMALACLVVGGAILSVTTVSAAPVVTSSNGTGVALLDGNLTLTLPADFIDQTPANKTARDIGVAVQLFTHPGQSQVVGISTVPTLKGHANDTSERAFNKMAQGALSGLKTQFTSVKKTAQSTVIAGGHKILRMDCEQVMKGNAIIGTLLITPYRDNVITVQVLSPAATRAEHDALVKTILDTLVFQ
ncbi:hypothetical protein SJI19_05205 [Acerihabitans sp. TG2]|uniref:hypothetical protein n=1 Tax=Acerihabitans sp. TG2 TaxID=3096008 RepID=UPI002B23B6A7|nr:hypothetical protein [Acerihabitans sp. TG2]MEA9389955.1 hypothetical protein [Acerihabitans sp. TG2]